MVISTCQPKQRFSILITASDSLGGILKEDGYVRMFLRGRPVTMHVPDQQRESYSLDQKVALPDRKLKLQWVLSVHPDMVTIATGQVAGNSKDGKLLAPHVRVWDSVSLNTLHVIGMGTFDRAVTCVAFSKSNGGTFLCAVDDANDHILSVWNWQKEKQLAEVKCSNDSVLGAVFHPMDTNLIVTCGKSHINFWTMEGNTLTKRQGLFEKHEKPKYMLCVAFAENGDAITGDSSGNIYVWAKGGNRISQVVSGAHEGGIFSVCVLKDGTLVSGGGKDRRVVLWLVLDTDTRDLVSMHTDGNEIISNVKYSPDGNFLAVASHDNFVYIYAVAENGRKYSRVGKCTGHSSFVTHLDWSSDSQYLVTNSGDYEILFWEASSGKHVTNMDTMRNLEWATSTCTLSFNTFGIWPDGADGTDINAVCRSHDGSLLASADDFGKVHLFSFPSSQPRAPSHEYGGHSSHVTNVAFLHDDSHLLSTGGKDTSILQWVVA
eukprot:superscaffoldBa00008081_g23067